MRIEYHNTLGQQGQLQTVRKSRIRIGRGPQNDIVLNSPYVADEAAVVDRRSRGWELTVIGRNGCQVGERMFGPGDRFRFLDRAEVQLFPYRIQLDADSHARHGARNASLDEPVSEWIGRIHAKLLEYMDLVGTGDPRSITDEYLLTLEQNLEEIARLEGFTDSSQDGLVTRIAGHCVRSQLAEAVISFSQQESSRAGGDHRWSRIISAVPERESELARLIARFTADLQLQPGGNIDDVSERIRLLDERFWELWDRAAPRLLRDFQLYLALREVKKQVKDIVFGYGPLEDLLRTPTVTEIMVVSSDRIYVEKDGVVEDSGRRFISDEVTVTIIERIVGQVGRRIDKSQPMVDARLPDGSRVNAVIPPLAVSGPCLTIRRFNDRKTIDDLIKMGALNRTAAEFLRAAVVSRRSVLIAGGTGTGKTTLLNILSDFIPRKERLVTIEDTAELQLIHQHLVSLETKSVNVEGKGGVSMSDLVRNALRMRPDRIIVGECRGAEALDMLQAMNTGHEGSLTTVHANSPEDVLGRLEVMVQMGADLPISSIHRQIASAIDLVVQLSRDRKGNRRVTNIAEIVSDRRGVIRSRVLFEYEDRGSAAGLVPTGRLPTFTSKLVREDLINLDSFFA